MHSHPVSIIPGGRLVVGGRGGGGGSQRGHLGKGSMMEEQWVPADGYAMILVGRSQRGSRQGSV